ncbi:Hypothetical_protein [Hexamita inflata]|uniref:Hypothetical_protein n=1 Tax=Hexamita inflata TaxID=28002 RepID=A0AA86QYM2_9EUKA|nr:Hypothetical protein HINF_LOCUS49764 [Hexamita inflata]
MQYYIVTLPRHNSISENKTLIRQMCNCQMKNYDIGKVLVQVSFGNLNSLRNQGFIFEQINFDQYQFENFEEPQSVRNAVRNHHRNQQQQQNPQNGMLHQFQNNQRQNNQLNYVQQNQYQPNQRYVHENVEQVFQPKQYQQPQNVQPLNLGQQRFYQPNKNTQPFQQIRPIQNVPAKQTQPVQQQPMLQPIQQARNIIDQIRIPQSPINQKSTVYIHSICEIMEKDVELLLTQQLFDQLKLKYYNCTYQKQGTTICVTGPTESVNEIIKYIEKDYVGSYIIRKE